MGDKRSLHMEWEDLSTPVGIRLNEEQGTAVCSILGQCTRNPISGQIHLKNATITTDFAIVDLWERPCLFGSPDELMHDPYIFKIVPLPYRTWIYHYYFGRGEHLSRAVGDHGVMEKVLGQSCIDAPMAAGRWSPLVCYAPAALISCITADFLTAFGCSTMAIFNLLACVGANSPFWYAWLRAITGFPRFVFFIVMCVRTGQKAGEFFVTLSFILIILLLVYDFARGDFPAMSGAGYCCNYRVLRILPNRVFICLREGAAFLQESDDRGQVNEGISGVGDWHNEMAMIAEVRGLVVELMPMQRKDWVMAWEERQNTGRPVSFMGLDVFNRERSTVEALDMEEQVKGPEGAKQALIDMVAKGGLKKKQSKSTASLPAPGQVSRGNSKSKTTFLQ